MKGEGEGGVSSCKRKKREMNDRAKDGKMNEKKEMDAFGGEEESGGGEWTRG